MNDHEMDRLLKKIDSGEVPGLDHALRDGGRELLEEIMSQTPKLQSEGAAAVHGIGTPREPSRSGGFRWGMGLAAAAAVVLAIVVPTTLFRSDTSGSPAAPRPTTEPVSSGNPYLWISDPDWTVTYLGESADKFGWITFERKRDGATVSISWDPIREYEQHRRDQPFETQPVPATFLGRDAELYVAGDDHFELISKHGEVFVSFFGRRLSRRDFDDLSAQLREMTEQQWLDGLPDTVIRPADTLARTRQYTADIPLPAGFDVSAIPSDFAMKETALRSIVISKVTCGWLEEYAEAYEAGDESRMAAADQALSGSAEWAASKEAGPDQAIRLEPELERMSQREKLDEGSSEMRCG